MRCFRIIFIALLSAAWAMLAAPDVSAQWVRTSGPSGAGADVASFAVSGTNLFAGTAYDGVFVSIDSGSTWTKVNNGLTSVFVSALAIIDTNLFAGTINGVFISTDSGVSWDASEGDAELPSANITAFAVIDTDLFAATYADVFLSTNYGKNWSNASAGLPVNDGVTALTRIGSMLFAGTTDSGVYLSTDSGTSWTSATNGLPNTLSFSFTAIGTNIFVGTDGDGIFLSTNNGADWTELINGLPVADNLPVDAFAESNTSTSSTMLFAGIDALGVYLSNDSGKSWRAVNEGLTGTTILSLVVFGSNLYAGTSTTGVWRRPLSDFGVDAVAPTLTTLYSLANYPNPFTQSTTISFSTPESGVANVSVVNILGTEVAHIFSGELSAGEHSFSWDASGLPDGMYECIVQMNDVVERVPMVLAR